MPCIGVTPGYVPSSTNTLTSQQTRPTLSKTKRIREYEMITSEVSRKTAPDAQSNCRLNLRVKAHNGTQKRQAHWQGTDAQNEKKNKKKLKRLSEGIRHEKQTQSRSKRPTTTTLKQNRTTFPNDCHLNIAVCVCVCVCVTT